MGTTKTKAYTTDTLNLAAAAKALGHPARLAIVEFLAKTPGCITNDIVNELPIAQPTVSQHLKELRNAGIIRGEVEGTSVCYCLNPDTLDELHHYFELLSKKSKNLHCC